MSSSSLSLSLTLTLQVNLQKKDTCAEGRDAELAAPEGRPEATFFHWEKREKELPVRGIKQRREADLDMLCLRGDFRCHERISLWLVLVLSKKSCLSVH